MPSNWKRNVGAVQSKATVRAARADLTRLGPGHTPRSKLFPSNWTYLIFKPNCCAVSRPVCTRHRSTARCRATAMMAFLRCAPVAFAPLAKTASLFLTGGYCGWKRTMRQAHSTRAALSRGFPRLVTLPGTRLLPLLRSPGHSPV